ncbi:hypothetical protein B0H17DRAFT_1129732 [Mycena rosella]|uniref:Uncharacterized protein n=1 Tax=Mycena rosella TaxID=1033263 RepID=A0AAD7GK37_MYCRO|nr:hypothetical protein B0H17DRAFT_1129732 [Mycena rosella]
MKMIAVIVVVAARRCAHGSPSCRTAQLPPLTLPRLPVPPSRSADAPARRLVVPVDRERNHLGALADVGVRAVMRRFRAQRVRAPEWADCYGLLRFCGRSSTASEASSRSNPKPSTSLTRRTRMQRSAWCEPRWAAGVEKERQSPSVSGGGAGAGRSDGVHADLIVEAAAQTAARREAVTRRRTRNGHGGDLGGGRVRVHLAPPPACRREFVLLRVELDVQGEQGGGASTTWAVLLGVRLREPELERDEVEVGAGVPGSLRAVSFTSANGSILRPRDGGGTVAGRILAQEGKVHRARCTTDVYEDGRMLVGGCGVRRGCRPSQGVWRADNGSEAAPVLLTTSRLSLEPRACTGVKARLEGGIKAGFGLVKIHKTIHVSKYLVVVALSKSSATTTVLSPLVYQLPDSRQIPAAMRLLVDQQICRLLCLPSTSTSRHKIQDWLQVHASSQLKISPFKSRLKILSERTPSGMKSNRAVALTPHLRHYSASMHRTPAFALRSPHPRRTQRAPKRPASHPVVFPSSVERPVCAFRGCLCILGVSRERLRFIFVISDHLQNAGIMVGGDCEPWLVRISFERTQAVSRDFDRRRGLHEQCNIPRYVVLASKSKLWQLGATAIQLHHSSPNYLIQLLGHSESRCKPRLRTRVSDPGTPSNRRVIPHQPAGFLVHGVSISALHVDSEPICPFVKVVPQSIPNTSHDPGLMRGFSEFGRHGPIRSCERRTVFSVRSPSEFVEGKPFPPHLDPRLRSCGDSPHEWHSSWGAASAFPPRRLGALERIEVGFLNSDVAAQSSEPAPFPARCTDPASIRRALSVRGCEYPRLRSAAGVRGQPRHDWRSNWGGGGDSRRSSFALPCGDLARWSGLRWVLCFELVRAGRGRRGGLTRVRPQWRNVKLLRRSTSCYAAATTCYAVATQVLLAPTSSYAVLRAPTSCYAAATTCYAVATQVLRAYASATSSYSCLRAPTAALQDPTQVLRAPTPVYGSPTSCYTVTLTLLRAATRLLPRAMWLLRECYAAAMRVLRGCSGVLHR